MKNLNKSKKPKLNKHSLGKAWMIFGVIAFLKTSTSFISGIIDDIMCLVYFFAYFAALGLAILSIIVLIIGKGGEKLEENVSDS